MEESVGLDVGELAMTNEEKLFSTTQELSGMSAKWGGVVYATYGFPAKDLPNAKKMALQIASGQTLGYIPDSIEKYLDFIARIVAVETNDLGIGRAVIAFPGHLFGTDIAGMLTILFGKISFTPGLSLDAISGDAQFLSKLPGPRFGLEGIRKLAKIAADRPLLMAILKPGLGPNDQILAENFARLIGAGTQLVKDDEVRVDLSLDDARRRLDAVLKAGGGRGIYVQNLTGPAFQLRDRALRLQSAGAQALLFSPFTYGLSVLQALCSDVELQIPVFAHPAFTGVMYGGGARIAPSVVLGTLMRWAGCDAVLFPSPYGSIALPKTDALAVHDQLICDQGKMLKAASVPSAGIVPELVKTIFSDFGREVVINAGTGIARNEGGIERGAKAFLSEIDRYFGPSVGVNK